MNRWATLAILPVFLGCSGQPTLDTSSAEHYRQSVAKVMKGLSPQETKQFLNGVSCIMFEGKQKAVPTDRISELYIMAGSPWVLGDFRTRLERLNGLTAADVINKGTTNPPQRVKSGTLDGLRAEDASDPTSNNF